MIILLFFLFENIICTEDMFSFNRHSGGIIQKEIERINFMQKSWTVRNLFYKTSRILTSH